MSVYDKLMRDLEKEGQKDSVHAASYYGIEYMSKAGLVLMLAWAGNLFSQYLAAAGILLGIYLVKDLSVTAWVLKENSDNFETLLEYVMITLAFVFIALGVRM